MIELYRKPWLKKAREKFLQAKDQTIEIAGFVWYTLEESPRAFSRYKRTKAQRQRMNEVVSHLDYAQDACKRLTGKSLADFDRTNYGAYYVGDYDFSKLPKSSPEPEPEEEKKAS